MLYGEGGSTCGGAPTTCFCVTRSLDPSPACELGAFDSIRVPANRPRYVPGPKCISHSPNSESADNRKESKMYIGGGALLLIILLLIFVL